MKEIFCNYNTKYDYMYLQLSNEEKEIMDLVIAKCEETSDFRDVIFSIEIDEDLLWDCAKSYCSIQEFQYEKLLDWIADDFFNCLNKKAIFIYDRNERE